MTRPPSADELLVTLIAAEWAAWMAIRILLSPFEKTEVRRLDKPGSGR